ncbi:MAG: Glu/Leu/Phe/Val dehydrogenase dimerization domain-containing protein [Thermoanaerobaculia bacterium]
MPAGRSVFDLARELGHEQLVVVQRPEVGLRAVIAIHDTTFGPAIGGTRMRRYPSFDVAVADALRLSQAMTAKAVFAGMRCGGGKAVIDGDPGEEKSPELLAAYGSAVEELGGRFATGCDMGIDVADLAILARATRFVGCTPGNAAVDASDLTALGLFAAMRAVAARLGRPLEGLRVALQGVGEVGRRLALRLAAAGCRLVVSDALPERAAAVAGETGARVVEPGRIFDEATDLFSPNAAGEAIDDGVAARLDCRAVVGAANNPLADERAGEILAQRGIVYAPDFVVNAGGLLSVLFERGELDEAGIVERVERIGADLDRLLDEAERAAEPPFRTAGRIVAARLAAERSARRR